MEEEQRNKINIPKVRNMVKDKKNIVNIKYLLAAMGIGLLIFSYIVAFTTCRYVRKEVTSNSFANVRNETSGSAAEINIIINKDKKMVNLIAKEIEAYGNIYDTDVISSILGAYDGDDWMEQVVLVYPDNSILLKDGRMVENYGGIDYDKEINEGEHVSEKIESQMEEYGDVVRIYSPVRRDGENVGLVYGIINLSKMAQKLTESLYSDKLTLYIMDSTTGDILMGTSENAGYSDIDELIDGHIFKKGFGKSKFINKIKRTESAECSVYSESNNGYVRFYSEPVGEGVWTVIISTNEADVMSKSYSIVRRIEICTMILGILAVIYVAVIIYAGAGQRKRISRQKDDFEKIVQGTVKLFSRFAIVDLDEDTYEYYVRSQADKIGELADRGTYEDFVRTVFSQFIAVDDESGSMEKYLTKNKLYEGMRGDVDVLRFEYVDTRNRGYRTLSILCLERKGARPVKLLFAAQDITELKLKEEEYRETLKDAFDTAERANKAKSQFLSNMSHDIRTPLNAIIGMGAIAETYIDDRGKMIQALETITSSGRHLLGMINDVLDMSKIESGNVRLSEGNANITEIVDNAIDMISAESSAKRQKISVNIRDVRHENIIADGQRIEQLFTNLISNAVKYTPEGGSIKVMITEKSCDNPKLGRYKFMISDTGIGMSKEYQEHIFEPFTREERAGGIKGTGLGMSIVKNIINMMGGSIQIDSEEGKGTTFTIQLSLKLQDEEIRIKNSEVRHDFTGNRALLAEDNKLNMEIASEIFKMVGIEVETAQNGMEALKMFKERASWYYDIIFMDIRMPELDGYAATREIRALGGRYATSVPIVAMTANAFAEDVAEAARAGMNEHLSKPIEIEKLLSVLDYWLQ